ncbi:phage tail tape measure protein [Neisseria leonii]|uniref:phage tail tape measure protein n=1 Tax=Neisseria leonii TaxID=2995413 RepID=UPI00237B5928|nr:phage tail tape measure protein [Neisseria sp. 3986]MDD9325337.1 phage tail tape measure protein [Neisseria sp. 3986]
MASDLGVSIKVSAAVGGALSGLVSVSKAMKTLESTTAALEARQRELGNVLERNKDRLGVQSARQLWQEYDKIDRSIKKLTASSVKLQQIQGLKAANAARWENIKSRWAVAAAAAGTLVLPVRLAIGFESAMADVKKVVNFETPQQLKEMEQDILHMTRKIPMAAEELAAIVAAGGQSGVARGHLTGFASDAAKMGVAFDMAAGEAGEAMATLSNVLQIPIPKISRLGDAVNHLSDNANSKAADIVNVLTRVGSDIKQLGMTETQGAAWGSTFLSMGKAPELAAQAIKGMVTSLSVLKAGGKKEAAALAELGLTAKEFADAMNKDAQDAVLNLLARVKQLPKDKQYPLLMRMFGRQYADDALMLANNVGEYNRQLDLLSEKDASGNLKYLGSMQREFENRSATTANQLQILKNGLVELGITVGSVILPVVNEFVAEAVKVSNQLSDWAAQHPVLTRSVIGTAASLLAFVAGGFAVMAAGNRLKALFLTLNGALQSFKGTAQLMSLVMKGGILPADVPGRLGTFVRALSAARTAMMGFSVSSLIAMWPVVLAVGAIALAGWTVYKAWNPIKAFFAGLWDGLLQGMKPLKPVFDRLVKALSGVWQAVAPLVMPVVDAVASALSGLWTTVQPFVQPILDFFGDFFSAAQTAEGGARSLGETVGVWLGEKISGLLGMVLNVWTAMITFFDNRLNALISLIANFSPVTAFQTAFQAVWTWLSGLGATFMSYGSMMIDGLVNGIKAGIGRAVAAVQGVVSAVKSAFTSDSKGMGIHSPSRVFQGYGGFMTEGLAIGVNKGAARPVQAVGAWAGRLKESFAARMGGLRADLAARISDSSADFAAARAAQNQAAGGMTVNFNPTINAPGGDPAQIQTALQLGLREFETLFNRMMADRERRAY